MTEGAQVWIVQLNPDKTHISIKLEHPGGLIPLTIGRRPIGTPAVGEKVWLWRARGTAHQTLPGLIAWGEVREVFKGPEPTAFRRTWRSSVEADEVADRVWLQLTSIADKTVVTPEVLLAKNVKAEIEEIQRYRQRNLFKASESADVIFTKAWAGIKSRKP